MMHPPRHILHISSKLRLLLWLKSLKTLIAIAEIPKKLIAMAEFPKKKHIATAESPKTCGCYG